MTRAGRLPMGRTWLVALAAAVAVLAGLEVWLRNLGYHPSVKDNAMIWAIERRKLARASDEAVALLGGSRAQLGIVPSVLSRKSPGQPPVFMLAADGSSFLPVLRHLAESPDFAGRVIASVHPRESIEGDMGRQGGYVDRYQSVYSNLGWLNARANQEIANRAEGQLVMVGMDPFTLVASLRNPKPTHTPMYANRYRPAFYERFSDAQMRRLRERRLERLKGVARVEVAQGREWRDRMHELIDLAARIIDRGGRVAFVRMPTTDRHWEVDQAQHPREAYWAPFAAEAEAKGIDCIHFVDHEPLATMPCPDTSHVGAADAIVLTRELVEILNRKGFFSAAPATRAAARSDETSTRHAP